METTKAAFVLVPGAWAGGWNWRPVVAPLREAGHEVYPVTLTGLGERSHLLGPDINLDTHISDVVNTVTFNDLDEVVLVGHSYAGMVITGVAGRVPERLRHIVYLDAFMPEAGETFRDNLPPELAQRNADRAEGYALPIPDGPSEIEDEAIAAWMDAKHTPHPVGTMTQPLSVGRSPSVPGTYVLCTKSFSAQALAPQAERARAAGFEYVELPTIHHCMFTMREELLAILLKAATTVR